MSYAITMARAERYVNRQREGGIHSALPGLDEYHERQEEVMRPTMAPALPRAAEGAAMRSVSDT